MQLDTLNSAYKTYKESALLNRYITTDHILSLLKEHGSKFDIKDIGSSVNGLPIYAVEIGSGKKKILAWSQMHGNESTTTKAMFDILNAFSAGEESVVSILSNCRICFIPILNPDGAKAYTRLNANDIDLNRDAQNLTQPESKALRDLFNTFKPDFCFNLHGQRTIFSAGYTNSSAIVSFLAPAQDEASTVTNNRKIAMEIIAKANAFLQKEIPGHVGIYDDTFNLNCVGDTFQSLNVPTVLFEAGHFPGDYKREKTREFMFKALTVSLDYIANNNIKGRHYNTYFDIPQNQKCFMDIIVRKAKVTKGSKQHLTDIGIIYQEKLVNGRIDFVPRVEKISKLSKHFGHREINAANQVVLTVDSDDISVGYENDFVLINSKKYSLKLE